MGETGSVRAREYLARTVPRTGGSGTVAHLGDDSAGSRALLRRGGLSFAGGVIAGGLGLVLTLVVGRGFGPEGSGVFFTVVAVVMVLSNTVELGADTGFVWFLPRLRATGRADEQRHAFAVGLVPVVLVAGGAAGALWLASDPLAAVLGGGQEMAAGLRWGALAVLTGTVATVCVAATRGLGLLAPLVGLQSIALPSLRVAGVGLVVVLGAGVVSALAAWSTAWTVVAVVAFVIAALRIRTTPPARGAGAGLWREFWGFSVPRAFAAVVEIALVWLDVILVTVLIGPAQAGIYAVASRFVTTGALGENALRIALAPRFSALFARGDHRGAQELLHESAPVMVALTWPIFLVAAVQAPALLSLFGAGFESGATALRVLCLAMLTATLLGPVQAVLLMSGNTRLQLLNKSVALAAMVMIDLIAVPALGIVGAALGWAAALLLDNGLAALQLRRDKDVRVGVVDGLRAAALLSVGAAVGLLTVSLLGVTGITALIVSAILVGGWTVLLLGWRRSPIALMGRGGVPVTTPGDEDGGVL